MLKSQPDQVAKRVEHLLGERTKLEDRLAAALKGGSSAEAGTSQRLEVSGVAVTVTSSTLEARDEIAAVADQFRERSTNAVLVLVTAAGRGGIHVAVSEDLVARGKKAGDLVNRLAALSGGKGGGRPAFASASAGDLAKLDLVTAGVPAVVGQWLGG